MLGVYEVYKKPLQRLPLLAFLHYLVFHLTSQQNAFQHLRLNNTKDGGVAVECYGMAENVLWLLDASRCKRISYFCVPLS